MQEYKVPEFTVMSLSAQPIKVSLEQGSDNNNSASDIFGPNV